MNTVHDKNKVDKRKCVTVQCTHVIHISCLLNQRCEIHVTMNSVRTVREQLVVANVSIYKASSLSTNACVLAQCFISFTSMVTERTIQVVLHVISVDLVCLYTP